MCLWTNGFLSYSQYHCSYDLLCHEGISRSLMVFQGKAKPPVFKTVQPPKGQALQKMIVKPEVRSLSFVTCGKRVN